MIRPTAPVRRQRRFRFRLVFVVVAAASLCGWFTPPATAAPPAGYYLVWSDEFNGTALDSTKWDYWLLGNRRDAVNVTNAVSLNADTGTLLVNGSLGATSVMVSGGTLAAGDSFKLFNAGSCSGAFAGLSPATPGPGLVWNTNTLAGDGTLRIAAAGAFGHYPRFLPLLPQGRRGPG